MAFRCQAPASGCHSAWSPPERLPLGLVPCHGSPDTPATLPGRHAAAPAPRTFPKPRGCLPAITGCPNRNVTLTQWPRSLPSPLVNLMDLLTSVPPRAATDFAAGQPLESKGQPAALGAGGKKGGMCVSESSRSCPGRAAPWPTRSRLSALFKLLSQTCPFHHLPEAVSAALTAAPELQVVVGRGCCSSPGAASTRSAGHLLPKKPAPLPAEFLHCEPRPGSSSPLPLPAAW